MAGLSLNRNETGAYLQNHARSESNLGLEVHLTSGVTLSCDETKVGRIKILRCVDEIRVIQEIDSCCL